MIMELNTLKKNTVLEIDTKAAYRFVSLFIKERFADSEPATVAVVHLEKTEENIKKLSALVKVLAAKERIAI